MAKQREAWGFRYWQWPEPLPKEPSPDDAHEVFRRCPTRAMARALGRKAAADPRNTSPGTYYLMRGIPDRYSMDGYDWAEEEQIATEESES